MHFKRLESCCYGAEMQRRRQLQNDFTTKLVGHLREAFTVPSGMRPLNTDRLWKSFFSIRSSSSFLPTALTESASVVATPVLYQHLTDLIFRMLIRPEYDIPAPVHDEVSSGAPGISEAKFNALRYAAGCVVRQVSKKIKKSTDALQDELLCCASKLLKGDQDDSDPGTAEERTAVVDRGGLWHVRENLSTFLCI